MYIEIVSKDMKSALEVEPLKRWRRSDAAVRHLTSRFGIPQDLATGLVEGAKFHGETTHQFTAYAGTNMAYEEMVFITYHPEAKTAYELLP